MHIRHKRQVFIQVTQKFPNLSTSIPFWQFLIILSLLFKDNSRTSPHMCAKNVTVVHLRLRQQFQWSTARLVIRDSNIDPHRVFDCKWPQQDVIRPSICPMQGGMHHKTMSHEHDRLNSMLSSSILVLRSNPKEGLTLPFFFTLKTIFLSRENTIIAMVVFNFRVSHVP